MPSCLVLSLSICYVPSKAMSTLGKSFNLLGSSFDSLTVLRNLKVLPKAGSLDSEGWQAKRVSNSEACVPVCVRACGLRVRACVQVQQRSLRTYRVGESPKGEGPCIRPFPLRGRVNEGQMLCLACPALSAYDCAPRRGGALADSLRLSWSKVVCCNLANVVRLQSRSLCHVPLGIIWRTDTPFSHVRICS